MKGKERRECSLKAVFYSSTTILTETCSCDIKDALFIVPFACGLLEEKYKKKNTAQNHR